MRTSLCSLIIIGAAAVAALPSRVALADDAPQPTQKEEPAASEANGIVQLFDEAISNVTLRPEQSATLQKLGGEIDAKIATVDEAKRDLEVALAKEIESGNVDADGLRAQMDDFANAAASASPLVRRGIEQLHDVLDPDQRKEFVDGLRDALKRRAALANPEGRVDEWTKTLGLSPDQQDKIKAIFSQDVPRGEAVRDRLERVLDAFTQDKLSIDDVVPATTARDRIEKMASRMVEVAKEVTQILTPEQRTIAANAIRDRAAGRPGVVSQALWAGRGGFYARGYRTTSSFGFSRGYATGFGGAYFI